MTTTTKKDPNRIATTRKWHGPCIYKIREVLSPIHKNSNGFRMVVAVPNMNGHKPFSEEPAPSFTKAYLLFQSSDYNMAEVQTKVEQHIRWLINRGFTSVESSEVYAARQLIEMTKNHTTTHKERDEEEEFDS